MKLLSVVIPVYNEERYVEALIDAVEAVPLNKELIVVDDGSSDRSVQIMQDVLLRRYSNIIYLRHDRNRGKGSAIRRALKEADGAYAVIQDADLEYDPSEIHLLLAEAQAYPGSAVFGSRFLRHNPTIYRRFLWGNKAVTLCLNLLYGSRLTDSYTCYKLLPTPLFRSLDLASNGFELEAEICAKCLRRDIPIREVPITYRPRTIEEGKKINWKDAVRGVRKMLALRTWK
jgi:glycosyltransferase involved in cell wall biosynthesis